MPTRMTNSRNHHPANALDREHMPSDYKVSLDQYFSRNSVGKGYREGELRIPENFGPKQSMQAFEGCYKNIIDYIVRITHKIWEDRDVEYIGDTYSPNSLVFDDYGLQLGNKKIIADTHHTTRAFSDIQLIADEVVWAGNDEIGFHTSHRTLIRGTNDGDSKYGPATGKTVDVLVIANCVAKDNDIFLEHVLYNNSSLVHQLGLDLNDTVQKMLADKPAGWPRTDQIWNELRAAGSPEQPISISSPIAGFDPDEYVRNHSNAIWNLADEETLRNNYKPDFAFQGPTGRAFSGIDIYRKWRDSTRAIFPDIEFQMDEVYWMGNDQEGYITSERWSAIATHTGVGLYGEPTGALVQIWGITQRSILNGKIQNEWALFNELDLMMQIAAAR